MVMGLGLLSADSHVDIIFSHIQMPGSMGGIEFARRAKQNYPAITIILTSGGPLPDLAEHPHFFAKPNRIANVVSI
jgi:CheY-like chemotaxis protein